jgi:hypothetical protein
MGFPHEEPTSKSPSHRSSNCLAQYNSLRVRHSQPFLMALFRRVDNYGLSCERAAGRYRTTASGMPVPSDNRAINT